MGYSIPNISVILVFISIPHSADEPICPVLIHDNAALYTVSVPGLPGASPGAGSPCPYGEHQGPRTRQKAEQLHLISIIRQKKWELIMLPAPLVFEPIRLFI